MAVTIKVVHQNERIYLHLSSLGIYVNVGFLTEDAIKLTKTILASGECDYATTNHYLEDCGLGIGKDGEEIT